MEGIALTGAWVDPGEGLLSMIALEMGVSSPACARSSSRASRSWSWGRPGRRPKSRDGENVLLAGGGLGNAVLFSIAKAMRENGNRVIYFAGYKKGEDLFKREEIEAATDQVIWSTDTGAAIEPQRPQDRHFRGNIVQAMLAYGTGELGDAAGAALAGPSHHRHRIGPDDGRSQRCAPRRSSAAVCSRITSRIAQHQLADAVHDEGSLRAVPAETRRSGNRQGNHHLFLPESGPADGLMWTSRT